MTISANYPTIRPSLLLDFANEQALDPRITFTRSTTGTYYNGYSSAVAEQNLFTYSQQFTNAVWIPSSVTTVDNSVVAPDGTTTAALVTCSAGTATKYLRQLVTLSANGALSFYAKAGTGSYIQIIDTSNGARFCNFDLSLGVLGTAGGQATGTITSVGSGWYRCSVVFSAFNGSATAYGIYFVDSASATYATTATTTGTFNLWGAQLEQRSAVTAYTPTTTTAITNYIPVLQTGAINQARFDHDPVLGTSLGLLIEQQSTNLVLQSQFASGWTYANATGTLLSSVAPDGTQTATQLVESTATSQHTISQNVTAGNATYTMTSYVKSNGRNVWFDMSDNSSGDVYSVFDLTGVTSSITAGGSWTSASSSITAVGNGWYRCSMTATKSAGATITYSIRCLSGTTIAGASYAGNGYSGIFIWGAQLEALAFPTSYIPTVASQVTRSADSASMTGTNFSSWYNNAQGSFYSEAKCNGITTAAFVAWAYSDSQNYIDVARYQSTLKSLIVNGNATQASLDSSVSSSTTNKFAIAYATNDFVASANAGTVQTDSSGSVPYVNAMSIGYSTTSGPALYYLNGTIKKIAYYPIRVTNAQLQALTGS